MGAVSVRTSIIMLRWIVRFIVINFAAKMVNRYFHTRDARTRART